MTRAANRTRRAAGWTLQVTGIFCALAGAANFVLTLWLGPQPTGLFLELANSASAIIFGVAGAWFGRIIRD